MKNQQDPKQGNSQRLDWYQEAKFGLFIHWGAYSVDGVEASWTIMAPELSTAMFGNRHIINENAYTSLPNQFNPVDFDPVEWVRLAKEAGMRYIVFTAKHHDGFCMFDAPNTDYKITNTPYGKDICLELAQACANGGMPLGFYYSPPDMHHPGYRDTSKPVIKNWTGEPDREQWGEYLDYMESHVRKLLTDYGDVRIMWFDGLTNHGKYDPERFHKLVHELSPGTLINDRLGEGYDFITPEQFIPKEGIPTRSGKPNPSMDPGGDNFFRLASSLSRSPIIGGWLKNQVKKYGDGTLELTKVHQEPYPSPERFQPWETCMTMGSSWAYNPEEPKWKTPGTLIRNLVEVVSGGGNFLLNIGPTPMGTFPPEAIERLQHIGPWMKTNHKSIYSNTYTNVRNQPWGQATRNANKIYLHVFEWPENGTLAVASFPGRATHISMMDDQALSYTQNGKLLEVTLPAQPADPDVMVLGVEIDPAEKGWSDYSAPVINTTPLQKYIQSSAIASFLINAVLNGLIAFFSFRARGPLPYAEVAIDILITVFIITFLTSWLVVGSARGAYSKGDIATSPSSPKFIKLPKGTALRALIISLLCVVGFGAIFLDGLIYLLSPMELNNWAYIIIKTLYTGASGGLASALSILSVSSDQNRS